jgi:hypothetical protein
VLKPIKVKTGENVADMPTKALVIGNIEHLGGAVFVRSFHTPEDLVLWRMGIWYTSLLK